MTSLCGVTYYSRSFHDGQGNVLAKNNTAKHCFYVASSFLNTRSYTVVHGCDLKAVEDFLPFLHRRI